MQGINPSGVDGRRLGVEKLTEGTYHSWKTKMKWLLIHDQLWDTVLQPPPSDPTPEWSKKNCKALSLIGLSVDDRFQVDLLDHDSAYEAWNSLAQLHQRNTIGSRLLLYRKLVTSKYSHHMDMGQHLANILEVANRLSDIGHPVNQELLCSALLGSLPPEYGPLITTIEGRSDESITAKYVREKILEEYTRLNESREELTPHTQALNTQRTSSDPTKQYIPTCYYCRKVGHIRRDCRMLKQHMAHQGLSEGSRDWNARTSLTRPPETHSKMVHMQNDPNFLDNSQSMGDSEMPRENLDTSLTELRIMCNHTALPSHLQPTWLVDSGACLHMTNESTLLDHYQELSSPMTVISAGGHSSQVIGKGQRSLLVKDSQERTQTLTLKDIYLVPALTDNLLSVSALEDASFEVTFKEGRVTLLSEEKVLTLATREQGLYIHREKPPEG